MIQTTAKTPNIKMSNVSKSEVIDLEQTGITPRQRMEYETWLPFAAKTYHISKHPESYLVVPVIIMTSDLVNRNGVAFPLQELVKFQPPPIARQAYKAWCGCPTHWEHDNEDVTKAHGVVFDSVLRPLSGYGKGKLWKVVCLLGFDKDKYPDRVQKIARGEINTYSMGAWADSFTCSYCGSEIGKCHHLDPKSNMDFYEYAGQLVFRNACGISPIEVSAVEDPAYTVALSDQVDSLGEDLSIGAFR